MSYQFYNPHPEGKFVGDCVKRAITKATGWNYQAVKIILNRTKKIYGGAKFNNWEHNVVPFMKEVLLATKITCQPKAGGKRFDGHTYPQVYRHGTYIVQVAHHIYCVQDGVVYDSFDSLEKCVYTAWQIPAPEVIKANVRAKFKDIYEVAYACKEAKNGNRFEL